MSNEQNYKPGGIIMSGAEASRIKTDQEINTERMEQLATYSVMITGEAIIFIRKPSNVTLGQMGDINKEIRVFTNHEKAAEFLQAEQARTIQKSMG